MRKLLAKRNAVSDKVWSQVRAGTKPDAGGTDVVASGADFVPTLGSSSSNCGTSVDGVNFGGEMSSIRSS